jgi:hypothetical protein
MLLSAELLWCLAFVQKSNFQEKSWKILQKFYFARRPTEPEGETKGGSGLGSPPGGVAQAWPRPPLVRPPRPSPRPLLLPTYTLWPERSWGSVFSQIDFRCAATIRNRDSEPETPFWHPVGTGIWRRSSSPSSPTSLHQPSMTPPSMCE